MKRFLAILMVGMLTVCEVASADLVNLTKAGTTWVWRVENGDDAPFLLMETGAFFVTEANERLVGNSSNAEALYNQLVAQGWTITDTSANIPQALAGTAYATALDFALNEDSTPLVLENTNNLKLEN